MVTGLADDGWVIVKSTRTYDGGIGYTGPSWIVASLPVPTKPFDSWAEADKARRRLDKVNHVGWDILPYRPEAQT